MALKSSQELLKEQPLLAVLDRHSATIAIFAGGLVQVYLTLLAIDSMYAYRLGIWIASPYVRGVALLVVSSILLRQIWKKPLRFDPLVGTLMAFGVVASIVGLANGNDTFIFGRHFFAAWLMLTSYWLGVYLDDISDRALQFKILAYGVAAGSCVFTLVAAMNGYLGRAFTSLGISIPLLISLDFGLFNRSAVLIFACLAVIFITNLRMGVIGASIMLGVFFVFRSSRIRYKALVAPVAAIAIFVLSMSAIFSVDKVLSSVGFSIGERANRTFDALLSVLRASGEADKASSKQTIPQLLPDLPASGGGDKAINDTTTPQPVPLLPEGGEHGNMVPMEVLENVGSNRLSQFTAVYDAVNTDILTLIAGRGFGAEYKWSYYSSYQKAWQHYTLHQTDMMIPYFLLMGGVIFATILPILIFWQTFKVYLNLRSGMRLGSLFVLGFSATMFFGFQPNVPLFWLLLGALSRPSLRKPTQSARTND